MQLIFMSLLGVRLVSAGLSDTLVNVVVSASRLPVNHARVALPVLGLRVQGDQIPNTPELFKSVPGVFLQRTNQGGGSLFVRGLTGNQTLLVLDGIRFNNSTFRYGPNQYLNTIDPFSLEQVEVLRGSGSVQYGSDALTGAVQLMTAKPQFSALVHWTGQVLFRGISQGMETSALSKIYYQRARSSFSILAAKKKFGDITRGCDGAFQRPTGYDEQNLTAQYRQKIGKHILWENLIQQNSQDHVPVYHKVQLENYAINEMTGQEYRRAYSRLIYQGEHPWIDQVELTASIQQSIEKRAMQKNGSLTMRNEEDQVRTLGIIGQVKSRWNDSWSSSHGIEYYADDITSSRIDQLNTSNIPLRGLYPTGSTYATTSAFSLHEWNLQNWQVHAGLRYQQTQAFLPDTTVGNAIVSQGAWVYDLGTSVALGKKMTLFASIASGFRAPNLDDLGSLGVVDFRYELPAFGLKPESSITKNLGIRVHTNKWNSEFSVFHTELSQLISRIKTSQVIQGYPVYRKENVGQAFLTGFEWMNQVYLGQNLTISNQLSYTLGELISQAEPMRRIPPLFGQVELKYQHGKVQMAGICLFAARQDRLSAGDLADNRMKPTGTAGWVIFNLKVIYKYSPHIRFGMQGENLGNVPYRMHGSGIDGMGRNLQLQLSYLW
jgi:outer membrane receptor protein involved in Fe transport